MDVTLATTMLSALSHATRLEVFRALVRAEPGGVLAGELARRAGTPHNTMSAHLASLARADLVSAARDGRSITYRANLVRFRELMLFLLKDCCEGRPEICAPIFADLIPCCVGEDCAHG